MEPSREQSPEQQRLGGESFDSRTSQPGDSPPWQRETAESSTARPGTVGSGAERRRALRSRWRSATLASGWPFPGDWSCAGVDRVCDAVLRGDDLTDVVGELAEQRADSGIGLDETLHDLTVLHAVVTGAEVGNDTGSALLGDGCGDVPSTLLRRAALAWADVVAGRSAAREVTDALTGLTTSSYLRMRLHEVYRETEAGGTAPGADPSRDHYGLLAVTLRLPQDGVRLSRLMGVVLAADVLREVFDAGETVSLLRESTPVVLTRNDPDLEQRRSRAESVIDRRMRADPELARALEGAGTAVHIRRLRLPEGYSHACELIDSLS